MWPSVGQLERIENRHVRLFTWLHIEYSVWCVDALVICLLITVDFIFLDPHAHIVTPKRPHTQPCTHPPTLLSTTGTRITHTRTFITHIHIHALLTLLSVFSPQSLEELKRAVDGCQSVCG